MLDLSSLKQALGQLEKGLADSLANPSHELLRDGVIQRFEYTYELAHKMLKRYLEITEPTPAIFDEMSFPDLIRTGSEKGLLLRGWDHWQNYRKARGTTSHTYDSQKAKEVFAIIPQFLEDVRYFYDQLTKRQSKT